MVHQMKGMITEISNFWSMTSSGDVIKEKLLNIAVLGDLSTVKSGLTGSGLTGFSGLTGQDARSLQSSYPLQWEDSGLTGFGLIGFSGSSGQRIWSLQTDSIVFLPV